MAEVATAGADPDSVHDLRTSIRRLSECLRTFEDVYPKGEAGRVRRKLRKLMALAAEVRNRDITEGLFIKAGLGADGAVLGRLRAEKQDWQTALVEKVGVWTKRERPKHWRSALEAK